MQLARDRLSTELGMTSRIGGVGRMAGDNGWLVLVRAEMFNGPMITEFEGESVTWRLNTGAAKA